MALGGIGRAVLYYGVVQVRRLTLYRTRRDCHEAERG
jgi:hypothetical protein